MASELHCAVDETDETMAAAARALEMGGATRRRRRRTLLLAELDAHDGALVADAAATTGLRAALTAAPRYAELRAAEPLLLLIVLGRHLGEMVGERYAYYGTAYVGLLSSSERLAWALAFVLCMLLARRFWRADVVPLWYRRTAPARSPGTLTLTDAGLASVVVVLHAGLCLHALLAIDQFDLSRPVQVPRAGFDLVAVLVLAMLWRVLADAGGASGAMRYLPMLIGVFAVDLTLMLLAIGGGLTVFPWYRVPILHIGSVVVSYPMLRSLVLGGLFLALGYGLRRVAHPTPATRLLAAAALATGVSNALLYGRYALLPQALFDLGIAALMVQAARRR